MLGFSSLCSVVPVKDVFSSQLLDDCLYMPNKQVNIKVIEVQKTDIANGILKYEES